MFRLRHHLDVDELLANARRSDVTYTSAEAGRSGSVPRAYRHDHHSITLPARPDAFARAVDGLTQWQAHRAIGATVTPDLPPERGATVIVTLDVGPLAVIAPCRIVDVTDEDDEYGFTYGTLPGHPEEGEEAFVVRRAGSRVTFEVTAFSRPTTALARLGGPVTRAVQQRATRGYLRGLADWVADAG